MVITCDNLCCSGEVSKHNGPLFCRHWRARTGCWCHGFAAFKTVWGLPRNGCATGTGGTPTWDYNPKLKHLFHAAWNRWQPYSKIGLEPQFQDFQKVQLWNIGGRGTYPPNLGFNLQEKNREIADKHVNDGWLISVTLFGAQEPGTWWHASVSFPYTSYNAGESSRVAKVKM